MTASATAIVTALGAGPSTARSLSQRLDGITYANIRQQLRRLAEAGVVTKVKHGLYALPVERHNVTIGGSAAAADETPVIVTTVGGASSGRLASGQPKPDGRREPGATVQWQRLGSLIPKRISIVSSETLERSEGPIVTPEAWAQALAAVWEDFEAQNNPYDPRAWA